MTTVAAWIAAAQDRCDAATDGPWEAGPEGTSEDDFGVFAPEVAHDIVAAEEEADASFIAAARTDLPKALDALRAVLDLMAVADADAKWVPSDPSVGYIPTNHLQRAIATALGVQP